jgi:hypothetical protein
MKLKVIRYAGDIPKADLVSPLGDMSASLQLGRVEMDLGENWPTFSQSVIYTPISVGSVIDSYDRLRAGVWRGVVSSVQHALNESGELTTSIGGLYEPSR